MDVSTSAAEAVLLGAASWVRIKAEGRIKTNEVVISRPNVSAVVLYRPASRLRDVEVVLVREFRTTVSNANGYVREVPSGSTFKEGVDALTLALDEVREETGLDISPDRLTACGSRQLLATMSAHRAAVFVGVLTEDEVAWLRSQADVARGVAEDSEQTYVELSTLGEIIDNDLVDFSTLGIITQALM